MDIRLEFPGGRRVDAYLGGLVVRTDQPVDQGGDGTAVSPYDLFLASLATCAGFYVLRFCAERGLSTEGLAVTQRTAHDPTTHLPTQVTLDVTLPPSMPEKYRAAALRAAEGCKVKKTLSAPPSVVVQSTTAAAGTAPAVAF